MPSSEPPHELTSEPAPDSSAESDRVSVTDVNGTIARFEMTYSPPGERPVAREVRAALADAHPLGALPGGRSGPRGASSSTRTTPRHRARCSSCGWSSRTAAGRSRRASSPSIIVVSALATVLRTHMRGVLVSDDWIEARYLLPFGIPRARRWGWPQVLRVVLDGTRVGVRAVGRVVRAAARGRARDKSWSIMIVQHAQRRRIRRHRARCRHSALTAARSAGVGEKLDRRPGQRLGRDERGAQAGVARRPPPRSGARGRARRPRRRWRARDGSTARRATRRPCRCCRRRRVGRARAACGRGPRGAPRSARASARLLTMSR